MTIFVSSLLRGMPRMEEVARWANGLGDPQTGVELIAFTHDADYWKRLRAVLETLSCPVSFHGPYVGTEGTSPQGSEAWQHLVESYRDVFSLAREYGVCHVVYHMTQLGCLPEEAASRRAEAEKTVGLLAEMADGQGVQLLVENLPYPTGGKVPLYTNEQYAEFFRQYPRHKSIIDVGHAHMNGMDIPAFLQEHGDRVLAYHFHNNDGVRDQHNHIFDGTFSYQDFAPFYRRYTPQASIVMEYEPHVTLTWQELEQQVSWLREHFS